jgi:hypothetical protein
MFNQCFETGTKLFSKQVADLNQGTAGLIKYSKYFVFGS